MKIIKIYAPCSGVVYNVTQSTDEVFAQETLGKGFMIVPDRNEFYSPFASSTVKMIFDTKHAFYFAEASLNCLMHIGINTVNLQGKPFKLNTSVNEQITKQKKVVTTDLAMIEKAGLSTETLIIFAKNENPEFEITYLELGKHVEAGQLIGEITVLNELVEPVVQAPEQIKSKFDQWGESIYQLIGKKINFDKHYNCMTRLRFAIIDKAKVDQQAIKQLVFVKGINWNGQEMQIIIGGDCYKVKESIDKILGVNVTNISSTSSQRKQKSWKDKIFGFINGVMVPSIPVILAAGILMGLRSILSQTGAIQNVGDIVNDQKLGLADLNWYSGLMYIIAEVGIGFLGVFFCITTVKYLNGNILVAAFIGIGLASPYLYAIGGWTLLEIGPIKFEIKGYFNQIIPQICAGALYVYADKWIKSWMPSSIDIIFRTFLAYLIVMLGTFLILGPILSIIEGGIGTGVKWLGTLPYGIGTFAFALLWQPLVLTGMHVAVIMSIITNLPSPLYAVVTFAAFGQLGAALGIALITKNSNVKKVAYATIPAAFLGITEPAIYGINLPRVKPFIWGCLAAGIMGLIMGIGGINASVAGGMGILGLTRMIPDGIYVMSLGLIGMIITTIIACGLTVLTCQERQQEKAAINKLNQRLVKYFTKNNKLSEVELANFNKQTQALIKLYHSENILQIKQLEKAYARLSKVEVQLNDYQDKRNEQLVKLQTKMTNAQAKEQISKIAKLNKAINKITSDNVRLDELIKFKQTIQKEIIDHKAHVNQINHQAVAIVEKLEKDYLIKHNLEPLVNNYFNMINSLEISFNEIEAKEVLSFKTLIKAN